MAVREYIGARYVPIFADPIQWDPTTVYEPLTVVTDQGNSYVSRQSVPTGIQLDNTDYWILWADYNAQLQHYIDEVGTFDGRIDALEDALPISSFSSVSTVADKFPVSASDIGSNAVTTAKINSGAVTTAKIADGAVTGAKIADETHYIGIVGDSFSDESSEWPTLLGNRLGLSVINNSVAGSGFVYTGRKTFVQQFDELCADENIGNMDYIIVYGGINDWRYATQDYTDLTSAFQSIATSYAAIDEYNGKKPKLIFCPGNAALGNNSSYTGYNAFCHGIQSLALRCGLPSTFNVQYWLMFLNATVYDDDGIHPNSTGQKIIAGIMESIIMGSYDGIHRSYRATSLTPCSNNNSHADIHFDNGLITVDVYLGTSGNTVSGMSSTGSTLLTLPANMKMKIGQNIAWHMKSPALAHYFYEGSVNTYTPSLYIGLLQGGDLKLYAEANGSWAYGNTALVNAGVVDNSGNYTIPANSASGVSFSGRFE